METTQIFLHSDGEQRGPFVLDQIRSMWASGVITSDTLYWQEGMGDWELVSRLVAPNNIAGVTVPSPIRSSKPKKKRAGASLTQRQHRFVNGMCQHCNISETAFLHFEWGCRTKTGDAPANTKPSRETNSVQQYYVEHSEIGTIVTNYPCLALFRLIWSAMKANGVKIVDTFERTLIDGEIGNGFMSIGRSISVSLSNDRRRTKITVKSYATDYVCGGLFDERIQEGDQKAIVGYIIDAIVKAHHANGDATPLIVTRRPFHKSLGDGFKTLKVILFALVMALFAVMTIYVVAKGNEKTGKKYWEWIHR